MTAPASKNTPAPAHDEAQLVSLLLVDDNENNLLALESILEAPGTRLVKAQTAEGALLALLKTEYAAIILDVKMPDVSGIDLARLIKQRRKTQNIPIIFLTGHYLENEHAVLGYGAGAVDYLTKPVDPEILRSKVGVFVDLFRKTRALSAANAELESKNLALQHQAEERLQLVQAEKARTEAETANAAKDKFLAMLSHELRTPLTPVLHAITLLNEGEDLSPASKDALAMIERNIQLEARLIDDLLDLSRVRSGKLQLDFQSVDAHSLIANVVEIWTPELQRKKLHVETRLLAQNPVVRGDPSRLLQIFLNLLTNAIKFTPDQGTITLSSFDEPADGKLRLEVVDTGIGIPAPELGRIFDAFEQASHASAGLGLGLAICKALVDAHGGSIVARSEGAGRGSTFQVLLPVAKAPALPAPSPTTDLAPAEAPFQKLLIVEDHLDTAMALHQLLERRGYEVRCAHSVAEALGVAEGFAFDILITDIGLPDGSGVELFETLKHHHRSGAPLRGVALSGFGMEEDISRTSKVGFAAHLTKPISFAQLHRCLIEMGRQ